MSQKFIRLSPKVMKFRHEKGLIDMLWPLI